MATVSGTGTWLSRGVYKHSWTLTSTASTGRPATLASLPDKTMSVRGTFAGCTVALIGSNQSATVAQASLTTQSLNDSRGEGNALSFTAANVVTVVENPNLIYPKLTALGTSVTVKSVVVEVVAQSARR